MDPDVMRMFEMLQACTALVIVGGMMLVAFLAVAAVPLLMHFMSQLRTMQRLDFRIVASGVCAACALSAVAYCQAFIMYFWMLNEQLLVVTGQFNRTV